MNSTQTAVVATLTVRVPINAAGSLADGAVHVVERLDTVDTVVDADIQQVSPGLNDTRVDLRARIDFVDEDGISLAQRERELEGGVGVRTVERVEAAEPDAPPVMDVG